MTREQIYEFFARIDGPEGFSTRSICLLTSISLRIKDAGGNFSWKCPGDQSKTLSRKILNDMGIPLKAQTLFLSFLDTYEGRCECEILSNILGEEDGVRNFADEYLEKLSGNLPSTA